MAQTLVTIGTAESKVGVIFKYQVYFIREPVSGAIKIGIADRPQRRRNDLQAAHPYTLELLGYCPGGAHLERLLHEEFATDRLNGEWFKPSERLTARIKELCGS